MPARVTTSRRSRLRTRVTPRPGVLELDQQQREAQAWRVVAAGLLDAFRDVARYRESLHAVRWVLPQAETRIVAEVTRKGALSALTDEDLATLEAILAKAEAEGSGS